MRTEEAKLKLISYKWWIERLIDIVNCLLIPFFLSGILIKYIFFPLTMCISWAYELLIKEKLSHEGRVIAGQIIEVTPYLVVGFLIFRDSILYDYSTKFLILYIGGYLLVIFSLMRQSEFWVEIYGKIQNNYKDIFDMTLAVALILTLPIGMFCVGLGEYIKLWDLIMQDIFGFIPL